MLKKSSHRKETDVDFEEKKLNLGLGEEDLDKENDYYTRPASPALHGDVPPPYDTKLINSMSYFASFCNANVYCISDLKNRRLNHIISTHPIHMDRRAKGDGHLPGILRHLIAILLLLDTHILHTTAGDHIQNRGARENEIGSVKESFIITKAMIGIITDQNLVKEIRMDLPANLSLRFLLQRNDGQTIG